MNVRTFLSASGAIVVASFAVIFVCSKAALIKSDNLIRAHTSQVARGLQEGVREHGRMPDNLGEIAYDGFRVDFCSPRFTKRCNYLYFKRGAETTRYQYVVATSIPLGSNIWQYSNRMIVVQGEDGLFSVAYITEEKFQSFLNEYNAIQP